MRVSIQTKTQKKNQKGLPQTKQTQRQGKQEHGQK